MNMYLKNGNYTMASIKYVSYRMASFQLTKNTKAYNDPTKINTMTIKGLRRHFVMTLTVGSAYFDDIHSDVRDINT